MHREVLGRIWKIGRYPFKMSEVLQHFEADFLFPFQNPDHKNFNELYSLFLKFSALGLLQDIRNNFHS